MTVKTLMKLVIITVAAGMIFLGPRAFADTYSQTIHLTLRVVGVVALDIDENWMQSENGGLRAEAYTELAKNDINIDQTIRGDRTIWRFTKTE